MCKYIPIYKIIIVEKKKYENTLTIAYINILFVILTKISITGNTFRSIMFTDTVQYLKSFEDPISSVKLKITVIFHIMYLSK